MACPQPGQVGKLKLMREEIIIGGGEDFQASYLSLYAADGLLLLHTFYILFVVVGLLVVFVGKPIGWQWIHNAWFRYLHLGAISVVVVQTWLGLPCPLTVWENRFRAEAGDVEYAGSFIAHWMAELIYYQAPGWVFTTAYSLFGFLTLLSLFWVKPGQQRRLHAAD